MWQITRKHKRFRVKILNYFSKQTNLNHLSPITMSDLKYTKVMLGRSGMTVLLLFLFLECGRSNALCPSRCVCNDELLRATCEDAGLKVVPIQLNPELEIINLRDNKITRVHYALSFYANLRTLDISCNKITTLGLETFEHQTKLEQLNISNNKISALEKGTFRGLKSLRTLDISNNMLERLEGSIFLDFPDLEHLSLAKNSLTVIGEGVFVMLKNLRTLNLNGNQLLDVPTNVLRNLHSLQTLTLDDNLIKTISGDSFPILPDLKVLTLQSNVISEIHLEAFDGIQMLEYLDISNNNISAVPTPQLSKLPKLQELRVNGNEFTVIGPLGFQNLFDLRTLWISQLVRLKRIDARAFVDNIKLETVIMDGNINLQTLPTRLFHGNPLLTHLSVRGASLTTLDASHFPLDQLHSLYLGDNPLHCNCSMLWLWLLTRKQQGIVAKNLNASSTTSTDIMPYLDVEAIRCKDLKNGDGVLMVDVPESEVRCDATWLAITVVTTVVVFSLMSVACTLMYFLRNGRWCKKRRNNPEDVEAEIPIRTFHNHHAHNQPNQMYHNRHQNGALLMLVTKRSNGEVMDEVVLRHKGYVDKRSNTRRPVSTWKTMGGENEVPEARHVNIYSPHYNANGRMKKPTHIVYV